MALVTLSMRDAGRSALYRAANGQREIFGGVILGAKAKIR
jgi:hypothetical protein